MICFGPISSRRLGRSMGVNNIPRPKRCTYNCVYCQVGRTAGQTIQREHFFRPDAIDAEVRGYLENADRTGKTDFLTFVANGEPTLDVNIGTTITILKKLNIPVAVITNASLLNDEKVREDLLTADWVSVKTDAPDETTWRRINRPHPELTFDKHLEGTRKFAGDYKGTLCTETMLIRAMNDSEAALSSLADLIRTIHPSTAWISIPIRPPAESAVQPADMQTVNRLWKLLMDHNINAELLTGLEPAETGYTGNAENDILNITAVHPLREESMQLLLKNDHADDSAIESLLRKNLIEKVSYNSTVFYLRRYSV